MASCTVLLTAEAAGPAAPQVPEKDPRPVVRLTVKNVFNPEDKIFPQIVEGRLISDLADMETFRMVGTSSEGDYALTCTIRTLNLNAGTYYTESRDAESSGRPEGHDQVSATMDLDLLLKSGEKEIYQGSLSVQASRDYEI